MLLEKAYAKIHNCYESLISGFIDDALADMTALAQSKVIFRKRGSKTIKMRDNRTGKNLKGQEAKDLLWKKIFEARNNHSMMGCSALGGTEHEVCYPPDVPCGILSGHAYSVIDAFSIMAKVLK